MLDIWAQFGLWSFWNNGLGFCLMSCLSSTTSKFRVIVALSKHFQSHKPKLEGQALLSYI